MAPAKQVEYESQIRKLKGLIDLWGDVVRRYRLDDPIAFAEEMALASRGKGKPSIVVGGSVGVELGRPDMPSHSFLLTTSKSELIEDGVVRCIGPDLDEAVRDKSHPFAQIVMIAHSRDGLLDAYDLESTQYLANRLPGYMARTVPGRLWVRVSREAIQRGFRLHMLGYVLIAAYHMDFREIQKVEVLLITGGVDRVKSLDTLSAEVKVISGKHKKLLLADDGIYDCPDLNCKDCDEKAVCDALKDITVRYRGG